MTDQQKLTDECLSLLESIIDPDGTLNSRVKAECLKARPLFEAYARARIEAELSARQAQPATSERSSIRQFLIDYWEGEDDNSMAHSMIFAPSDFEAVRRTVASFAQHVDWLQQQCNERAVLKAKLETAEAALSSAKQPLHAEMARLNKRVIELTAELDRCSTSSSTEKKQDN